MMLSNALIPLIRPLQITSLNPFSVTSLNYNTSKQFNLWSMISIILLILLTSHGFVDSDFYTDSHTSIGKTIIFIKLCGVRFGHIIILIESFVQRRELMEIINILADVDVTFVKKLGVDVGHKDLKKLILKCLIGFFSMLISIEVIVLIITLNHSSVTFLAFWLARFVSFSVICLRYFQIMTFIYITQSRLSIINFNLTKLDNDLDNDTFKDSREKFVSTIGLLEEDNRNAVKMQKRITNVDHITIFRELFGKLWDVSNLINNCFGISLLICIGNDFGTITLNGYWMYLSYKKSKNLNMVWSTALWSIPHITCLLLIATFCYSTVSKVS